MKGPYVGAKVEVAAHQPAVQHVIFAWDTVGGAQVKCRIGKTLEALPKTAAEIDRPPWEATQGEPIARTSAHNTLQDTVDQTEYSTNGDSCQLDQCFPASGESANA